MPKLPFGDIGPCEVHFGYGYQSGDMPQIIKPYLGKVTIRIVDAVTDIHENGGGIAPINSFFGGTTVELEIPMVRNTLIRLAQTIGYRKMGSLSGSVLTLDNIAGEEMYGYAQTIVIMPICNNVPDPDPHNWIVLHRCHPYRDIELGFDRSGQRIHLVKFKVFPSREAGYEGAYLQYGTTSWREDYYDDFCGDALNPAWTTFPEPLPAGCTIGVLGCVCTIGITNGTHAGWWGLAQNDAPRMYMMLGAALPCRIETKLNVHAVPLPGWSQAGIMVARLPTSTSNIGPPQSYFWGRFTDSAGGNIGVWATNNIGINAGLIGLPWDSNGPYWLRVDISTAKVLSFSASVNGTDWTDLGWTVAYNHDPLYVGLICTNLHPLWPARAAPFDYFDIESYG